ncbi:solute carrier family 23 protein, partial [Streptomyces globisporus]|uniref:solute carrier family 23 protein n=2 Tax=Streptomyces TaxID=1883 RepID=UPI003F4D0451
MAAKPRFRKDADAAAPDVTDDSVTGAVAAGDGRKHPVDETLPPLKMFTSGLQHVAAMYAGVVAPPLIVGPAVGLTAKETAFLMGASLFTAGIATLLQTIGFWKVGARLPFVN